MCLREGPERPLFARECPDKMKYQNFIHFSLQNWFLPISKFSIRFSIRGWNTDGIWMENKIGWKIFHPKCRMEWMEFPSFHLCPPPRRACINGKIKFSLTATQKLLATKSLPDANFYELSSPHFDTARATLVYFKVAWAVSKCGELSPSKFAVWQWFRCWNL